MNAPLKAILYFTGAMVLLAVIIALSGCATRPTQAKDVDDYCTAVRDTATYMGQIKAQGVTLDDLKVNIRFALGPAYPAREVLKMLDVADMVYGGRTPEQIEQTCLNERANGTWFK